MPGRHNDGPDLFVLADNLQGVIRPDHIQTNACILRKSHGIGSDPILGLPDRKDPFFHVDLVIGDICLIPDLIRHLHAAQGRCRRNVPELYDLPRCKMDRTIRIPILIHKTGSQRISIAHLTFRLRRIQGHRLSHHIHLFNNKILRIFFRVCLLLLLLCGRRTIGKRFVRFLFPTGTQSAKTSKQTQQNTACFSYVFHRSIINYSARLYNKTRNS